MKETQEQESAQWFVLAAVAGKEVKIRDNMRSKGFECYIPMHYQVVKLGRRKERKLVPAINALLFVHSTKDEILEYKIFNAPDGLFFKISGRKGNHELMVVNDRDMENFMRVTQQVEQDLTYFRPDEIQLRVGAKIKVHGGVFDGVEGVLMRVPGRRNKQLVVSIPGVSAVAVSLSPEVVEVLDEPVTKSTDLDGDLKTLTRLATEKLFAPPDRQTQENEYNLMVVELRRVLPRVQLHKGYTASREAEIALAVYMGTKALDQDATTATERLTAAAHALKSTSLLRLRLLLYLGVLGPDADALKTVTDKVNEWLRSPLSEQQRKFRAEVNKLIGDS